VFSSTHEAHGQRLRSSLNGTWAIGEPAHSTSRMPSSLRARRCAGGGADIVDGRSEGGPHSQFSAWERRVSKLRFVNRQMLKGQELDSLSSLRNIPGFPPVVTQGRWNGGRWRMEDRKRSRRMHFSIFHPLSSIFGFDNRPRTVGPHSPTPVSSVEKVISRCSS
jgi:hypothetical protein